MSTLKELVGKNIKVFSNDPAPSPVTFLVTVANVGGSNYYFIDGVQQLQLELYEGNTYTFDQSNSSNNGHPLLFYLEANKSTAYTTGVTASGTPGSSGAKTVIVVASGAPTLYYQCSSHANMGGIALTPGLDAGLEGQIWYNETLGKFRTVLNVGAWASGGALGTGRHLMGFGGTQTAGIAFGGSAPPNEAITNTELYNGSSWSEVADLGTGRNSGSHIGISTAALYAGGHTGTAYIANSETWNGSSWSEGNNINAGRTGGGSFGITTAGVIAGGYSGPPGVLANVEEYDGTSWSEVNNLPTAIGEQGAIGTLTAGLVFGGTLPPGSSSTIQDATYEYDGTNWTSGGTLVTGVRFARGGGVQTAALVFGGQTAPAVIATSQLYNGSAFSLDTSLGSAINKHGAGATAPSTAALSFGGNPKVTATEEFSMSIYSPIAASWASGGTVPYSARQNTSFGTQTATINCGGTPPGQVNTSVFYNGSSWTATNALNVAQRMAGVAGTSTAGLAFGGIQPSGTYVGNMQSWNGSNWTAAPAGLNNGSYGIVGAGTQTSALRAGGENPAGGDAWNKTEEYNGTSWSEVNNMPAGVYAGAGGGVQTSAIVSKNTVTYEYDGTNWATGGTLATSRSGAGSGSTSSDSSLVFGGAPALANTELYNGTAWSNQPNMGTGRGFFTGAGTAPAGIAVQGGPPSGSTNITEEFTGEIQKLGYKSLTSS